MKRLASVFVWWLGLAACAAPLVEETARAEEPTVSRSRLLKQCIREKVVAAADLQKYGLRLDDNWQQVSPTCDVVILLHGLNSTPESNGALLDPVRAADFPCGVFNYPNDHCLCDSAKLLAQELGEFASRNPGRGVSLLAHSMGGLVARACIEDRTLDPGNVRRLVMIAPPTHGSLLAQAAVGLDLYEHGLKFGRGGFRASIADGLCEAPDDMQPGSAFLTELNARQRNAKTRYTILLGTGAVMRGWELALSRKMIYASARKVPYLRKKAGHIDEILADLDEIVAGRGDGAVAVKRGRLEGVDDTVLVDFKHLSVTGPAETDEIRQVHSIVLSLKEVSDVESASGIARRSRGD